MENSPDNPLNLIEQKDMLIYRDPKTNLPVCLDLRTGLPVPSYKEVMIGSFSNITADYICDQIREGMPLKEICKEHSIPTSLIYAWLAVFPEFKKRYYEARKQRADFHFDRALELAENAIGVDAKMIGGIKLAVDTHKWAAEKSDPDRFAKAKEEGNNGIGSITINLTTGVLDKPAPKDIVVDQFGNFQGFDNEDNSSRAWERSESPEEGEVTLNRDRFREERGSEEGTTEEEG